MARFLGRRGRGRRVLGGAGIGIVIALAVAGPASAHAQLESTQPNQSSVLLEPPRQVVLHFGEPVEIDFGSIRVIGPNGKRVDEGGTVHPGGDDHAVSISLPAHLGSGTYVVAWRVISADSHPVHGAFVFSVGNAAGARTADAVAHALTTASGGTALGVLFWIVRVVSFGALVLVVGVGAVAVLVLPTGHRRRLARLLWWSWAALLASTVAGIAVQGPYAAGLPLTDVLRPSLFDEVLHTRFGEVELLRIALLLASAPVLAATLRSLASQRRRAWRTLAGGALGIGLLATPGLAGHATTGGSPALGEILDVVHLAAASVWLGGLALLLTLAIPGRASPDADVWPVARRFSAYAFGSVVAVVATGVVQSVREVGSLYALTHTSYGRTLVVRSPRSPSWWSGVR